MSNFVKCRIDRYTSLTYSTPPKPTRLFTHAHSPIQNTYSLRHPHNSTHSPLAPTPHTPAPDPLRVHRRFPQVSHSTSSPAPAFVPSLRSSPPQSHFPPPETMLLWALHFMLMGMRNLHATSKMLPNFTPPQHVGFAY